MNRDSSRQSAIILAVIGIFPVVWLGLLIAPSVKGGLPEILPSLLTAFNDPFHIELCGDSLKTVLVLLLLYGMGIGIYLSTRRNYRRREEYVSELLGKETIDTNTYGKSEGRSGSYSTNYQISGRELLTPDEVRMLDNRYAILFIRGELPVMDLKYDILKHPNVAYTADGKGGVYKHGEVTKNVATIETLWVDLDSVPETELSETTYELLSDEDFENITN